MVTFCLGVDSFLRFLYVIMSHPGSVGVKLLESQPHAIEVSQTLITNQNLTSTNGGFCFVVLFCFSYSGLECFVSLQQNCPVLSQFLAKRSQWGPRKLWVRTLHLLCVDDTSHSLLFNLQNVPANHIGYFAKFLCFTAWSCAQELSGCCGSF